MSSNPLDILQHADPSLRQQIGHAAELAFGEGELSKKHKYLIALAIDAVLRSENGMKALVGQAVAEGATKQEIIETLRIVQYICGVSSTYPAAIALQDVL